MNMTRRMKVGCCLLCVVLTGVWISSETMAMRGRGGGRAGGGGGRSMSRSRPSSGRSPSMSRSSSSRGGNRSFGGSAGGQRPGSSRQPSRGSQGGQRPGGGQGQRPSQGGAPSRDQLNGFLNIESPGGRPSTQPGRGGAAGDFLQSGSGNPGERQGSRLENRGDRQGSRDDRQGDRRNNRGDRQDNRLDNRGDRQDNRLDNRSNRPDNRGQRIENRQQYQQNRVARRNSVRAGFRRYPARLPYYGRGYWGSRPWRWGWDNYANNWWKWATAATVTSWVVGGVANSQPAYINYGDNCYYEGDTVYYEGQAVASAEEYADQAQTIASSVPEVEPEQVEWLPLGIFALTEDGESDGPEPTIFLQLAISKEGIIAGTMQNTATGNAAEVQGTIDQMSQRAAWGLVDRDWPIMETGLYNLTNDDASALLHFEDGQTQQWLMVRLEEPENTEPAN